MDKSNVVKCDSKPMPKAQNEAPAPGGSRKEEGTFPCKKCK